MCQKTNNHPLSLLVLGLLLIFHGCQSAQNSGKSTEEQPLVSSETVRYANGFRIDHHEGFTKVVIHNPWANDQKPYEVYYLYKADSVDLPADGIKLKIPLISLAVNTFSYFEFLSLLDALDAVTGVTDGFRIYNPEILNKLENGAITDLGDPFNPNIEKTMALKPQAIINSAYAQQDNYSERLRQIGFPVIYSLEWMENTPLAKAEWIKLIAAFLDKGVLGDSIFNEIEKRYLAVQNKVKNITQQHTVMSGDNFQGTWYMPGGDSFNATLFRDAGLRYHYENNRKRGSIGLDIESVLTQFEKADYWFGCDADTYEELGEKDAKYLLLQSVKKRQVFNNHNRITPTGGNDYFESAIAHPDLLLSDLVKAVYPNLMQNHPFTYIKPLE